MTILLHDDSVSLGRDQDAQSLWELQATQYPSRHLKYLCGHLLFLAFVISGCASHPPLPPDSRYPMELSAQARIALAKREKKQSKPALKPVNAVGERKLTIFLDSQIFQYAEDGMLVRHGPISSGSPEHPTPSGSFKIQSKNKNKRSSSYTNYYNQNTPMPYSLQFHGPYFIHEGYLPGNPASHGCVRLSYKDAKFLFERTRVGDAIVIAN